MNIDAIKYRTARKRLWAAIVDLIVFLPFVLMDRYLLEPIVNVYLLFFWQIAAIFIPIIYPIIAHYKYGQTIGKWVAGVKVLDISETRNITLRQSILRSGVSLLIQLAGFFYYMILVFWTGGIQYLFTDFTVFTSLPLSLWLLADVIRLLNNDKRRALHDFIAQSVVVRTE